MNNDGIGHGAEGKDNDRITILNILNHEQFYIFNSTFYILALSRMKQVWYKECHRRDVRAAEGARLEIV